jgi:glucosyl-3-phosphoglycerate synthase
MSDISQHGLICTLQRLVENPRLDAELAHATAERPVTLVLPCHADDLLRPALAKIARELSRSSFISEILIPVNGLDSAGFMHAKSLLKDQISVPHRVLWCDAVADALTEELPGFKPGKGSNVWLATGLALKEHASSYILAADADVTTFRLEMLARLTYALTHPELGFSFAKSYYPRVTNRIYARVTRLFFGPLLQAILRACGHQPLLDFLRSFRYPLAGEFGFSTSLAASLPFDTGWGLEVGMLCDVFRRKDPREVCQVDAGLRYDHKHQPLGNRENGLVKMCREVAQTLFFQLEKEGLTTDPAFFDAVQSSFKREAAEAIRRSAALSKINGLDFDAEEEQMFVNAFHAALKEAAQSKEPLPPRLPEWNRASMGAFSILDQIST